MLNSRFVRIDHPSESPRENLDYDGSEDFSDFIVETGPRLV